MPRVFRLPRVKFKRPRWPKRDRIYLIGAFAEFAIAISSTFTPCSPIASAFAALLGVDMLRRWWRSRDDDGQGPRAT